MLLMYVFLFLSFVVNFTNAAEPELENRVDYYCMEFQPQMKTLLDKINQETILFLTKSIYDGQEESKKRIKVVYADFKKCYDTHIKKIEEQEEMLLIARQNSEDLKEKRLNLIKQLDEETELDAENLQAYAKILWEEYKGQLSDNIKQIENIHLEIKRIKKITDQMKPYIDDTDKRTAGSITHQKLLDYAKQQAPHIFNVSDPVAIESINKALVHLLGENN